MKLNDLAQATYVALETFKKSGQGVITPVWVTEEGSKLYVITVGNSWKVKRMRNNSRVRLAKSDMKGTPEGEWVEAQGHVLTEVAALEAQKKRLLAKYGWQYRLFSLIERFRGRDNVSVVLEISPA